MVVGWVVGSGHSNQRWAGGEEVWPHSLGDSSENQSGTPCPVSASLATQSLGGYNRWYLSSSLSATSNLYSSILNGDNEPEKGRLIPLDSGLGSYLQLASRRLKTCRIKHKGVIQYPTNTPSNSKKLLPGVFWCAHVPRLSLSTGLSDWVQGPRSESWLFCSELVWPCAIHLNLSTPKFLCP